LEIIETGINAQRWDDFKTVGFELISEMMFHLQKEEMTVVQRLAVFLDARADHQLALKHVAERPPIRSQGQSAAVSIVMPIDRGVDRGKEVRHGRVMNLMADSAAPVLGRANFENLS
jgi:hypothetical protein